MRARGRGAARLCLEATPLQSEAWSHPPLRTTSSLAPSTPPHEPSEPCCVPPRSSTRPLPLPATYPRSAAVSPNPTLHDTPGPLDSVPPNSTAASPSLAHVPVPQLLSSPHIPALFRSPPSQHGRTLPHFETRPVQPLDPRLPKRASSSFLHGPAPPNTSGAEASNSNTKTGPVPRDPSYPSPPPSKTRQARPPSGMRPPSRHSAYAPSRPGLLSPCPPAPDCWRPRVQSANGTALGPCWGPRGTLLFPARNQE